MRLPVAIYFWVLAVLFVGFLALNATATTYYVNAGNPAPAAPYTSWLTAATNIQDAVTLTANGDTVLVTNGVYAFGGVTAMGSSLTNRIAISNAVTVESVNGPWTTTILGGGMTNGTQAIRCAWLTNGASLIGFTLTGGATRSDDLNSFSGGGVWCASSNAYVKNCVIVSNTALDYGAAAYQGTINSCLISGNGGNASVGAVYGAILNNCTIVSNNVFGVLFPPAMTNCIIYFNYEAQNYNVSGSAFSHCCTTPALAGTGNFTNAPLLFADGVHLANNSPCLGAGVYLGGGTDIFGEMYSNPPSVGCAEQASAPLVTTPRITLTGNPVGFSVGNFAFTGATPCNFSWLQNSQPLVDNGHFSGTQTSSLVAAGVSLADAANYQVVASNAFGVVTSSIVTLTVHCVNPAGLNPTAPYTSWATAATNIQNAITASASGDVVLATNGLYNSGGESVDNENSNRVTINKSLMVQSVNGAGVTVIQGAWDPTSTNGPDAVRGVWMTNNTILSGFTISGGATASGSSYLADGGGILAVSTNIIVCNCVLSTNIASSFGGGIFGLLGHPAAVINCRFNGNQAASYGGGANECSLQNCILLNNSANQGNGGGAANCTLTNCALVGNSASGYGGAVYSSMLLNCTVTANTAGSNAGAGSAVYSSVLTNCIVIDNLSATSNANTNYVSSVLAYCCADPLPSGPGNIDVNPQVLADGFHLAPTSPCIGAGTSTVVLGTDIDGQPWKNPPSIGCDEWYPQPLVIVQPTFQIGSLPHDLSWNLAVAGQSPFAYFWTQNGVPISDDGHHINSGTANMVVDNFGPGDAGAFQVVVTNSVGSATSAVVQMVIHAVNAAGANPLPPYSSWANAATNIQDAVNVAAPGDIVLVTNGIYSNGGAQVGGLTNRVMLNQPITLISVNGFNSTIIRGAWDPVSTNGPDAVRCVWIGNGAVLNGFTLENGATLASGNSSVMSGGGVWCYYSTNGLVLSCELTNNSAVYGGGAGYAVVNNSLIIGNFANYGGGAYYSSLNNCTIMNNQGVNAYSGAGTYNAIVRNSIVIGNYYLQFQVPMENDFYPSSYPNYACSCSAVYPGTLPSAAGNIVQGPIFIDLYHVSTVSPTYDAGSAAYSTGYDLDGQPWNNPPSMGCSEIVSSNLVGPLSVNCSVLYTNVLVNNYDWLYGAIQGHAAFLTWSFSDGPVYSNLDNTCIHQWTSAGTYPVTLTAYNNDNPSGVSTNLLVYVVPSLPAQIQSPVLLTNGFGFQFVGQMSANYLIQYTTNLSPPITWQELQEIVSTNQETIQFFDPSATSAPRFYRVVNQSTGF